jgi:hypothetical protein
LHQGRQRGDGHQCDLRNIYFFIFLRDCAAFKREFLTKISEKIRTKFIDSNKTVNFQQMHRIQEDRFWQAVFKSGLFEKFLGRLLA